MHTFEVKVHRDRERVAVGLCNHRWEGFCVDEVVLVSQDFRVSFSQLSQNSILGRSQFDLRHAIWADIVQGVRFRKRGTAELLILLAKLLNLLIFSLSELLK